MQPIIETNSLTKRYKQYCAVNQMSIQINKGEIYGLIGKNGAGKTTLMKLLLGLTRADSGKIKLFDSFDLDSSRRKIGSLIESPALYKNETAYENMKRFAILAPTSDEEIRRILALVKLDNTGNKKVKEFSLGMKQRLGIAIALLGSPELLILDEPINGLDPAGIKEIRDVILELNAQGVTFLISSHLLDELGKIATRYGIMANGVLVEEITADELKNRCKTNLLAVTDHLATAANALKAWKKDIATEFTVNGLRISSEIEDSSEVTLQLVNAGVRVYELKRESIDPEEFFIERMG